MFEENKPILITGAAGFIGFHLARLLLSQNIPVIGFDNINDYYDINLKHSRLEILNKCENFTFIKGDIADAYELENLFKQHEPQIVVNLAAQAGVRYSIENPQIYINSNIQGFLNILENCRHYNIKHLIYASSSSVYGNRKETPFCVGDDINTPVSLYAATKISNEIMAHTYSHLFSIPATGLRFFTVYGSYGRPDMAYFTFTDKIFKNEPIKIFNNGDLYRDFTYVDDITEAISRMLYSPPKANATNNTDAQYKIYNIGGGQPENLLYFVETLEKSLGKTAIKEFAPMQPGDVYQTFADTKDLENDFGFKPKVRIEEGLKIFADWYKKYYKK